MLLTDKKELHPLLVAESNLAFAEKFMRLYAEDIVLAVSDSTRYEDELNALESQIHPDTKLILFTSGSEGKVKKVQLSRANIEANTQAVVESLNFEGVSEQFLFLPLHYSFGLLGQLIPAQTLGIQTHFLPNMMALRSVKLRGMLSAVGSQWDVLVKLLANDGPYREVTHVVSAGSRLSEGTRVSLKALFPNAVVYNNYGQTECSPRILSLSSSQENFFSNDTGYPVKGLTARLSDEGELWVKGPQVMLGYLGDIAATSDKIKEGWLHTGDQATIASDGRVTILGRKDDLVKVGGERLSLLTYSQTALELGLAREALALLYTDRAQVDRIALILGVGAGNAPASEKEVMVKLKEALKGKIASGHVPALILFRDELPKLPNGKLDRSAAKKMIEEALK
jgi:long-chain acyl-CoA synthetase